MSKYDPLADHFHTLTSSQWHASFAERERILGFRLPASARNHSAWWANSRDGRPQKATWMDAGWATQDLNQTAVHVTFVRVGGGAKLSGGAAVARQAVRIEPQRAPSPPYSCDMPSEVACSVGFSWAPLGQVRLGQDGRLEFPPADSVPAIYRFHIRAGNVERRYVGQTENLVRRFGFYRAPGPTQPTNVRLNAEFLAALHVGAEVGVSVSGQGAWIDWGVGRQPADFSSHGVRCLFENAAILEGPAASIDSLNRAIGQTG